MSDEDPIAKYMDRMLALMQALVERPQPAIHVHVGGASDIDPETMAEYAKKKKNAMDAEGAHDGDVVDPGSRYPRPYVG